MSDHDDRSKWTGTPRHVFPVASNNASRSTRTRPTAESHLFLSAKTATAIPVRHPALLEALIQASLDHKVRSIAYIASARIASGLVNLDAIVLQRDDGRFLLDVVPARRIPTSASQRAAQMALAELGLRSMVLTTEDIRREPRYANTRLVWSHRETPVPVGLRMHALQTLLDNGPMPLGELLKSVRSKVDPVPAVMALACANLVHLDLVSQALSPTTIVGYCAQTEMP
jgi:hypothetical protein